MRTLSASQIYMNMHKDALVDMKAARVILRTALETLAVVNGGEYKTLKAKKAAIKLVLDVEVISKSDAVGHALQHMGLVSTGANALRNAMMGFSCCALAATFNEFDEQCAYVMQCGVTAMNAINRGIDQCVAHAEHFRSRVQKEARARLPAVAVSRKEKRHAIAQHMAAWTDTSNGEYIYWQPLQSSKYPFRMWALALSFNYRVWDKDGTPSKW